MLQSAILALWTLFLVAVSRAKASLFHLHRKSGASLLWVQFQANDYVPHLPNKLEISV